jgi:hypothetical protein
MPKQFEHWVMQPVYPVNNDGIEKCEMRFQNVMRFRGMPLIPLSQDQLGTMVIADPVQWEINQRVTVGQVREAIERSMAGAYRRHS